MPTDLSAFVAAASGQSVCRLHSLLILLGRTAFLSHLKDLGVRSVGDRQAICNALTAAARAGQLPSPSLETLRALLDDPVEVVTLDMTQHIRVFALCDLRAEYPYNRGTALSSALSEHKIGAGDVCICCGRTATGISALRETLHTLNAAFERVLFLPCDADLDRGPPTADLECADDEWANRRPQCTLPSPIAPRDARQRLHTALTICASLPHVTCGPIAIRRSIGGNHDVTAAPPAVAMLYPMHVMQCLLGPGGGQGDTAMDDDGTTLEVARPPCESEGASACDGRADHNPDARPWLLTCSNQPPQACAAVAELVAAWRPAIHVCAGFAAADESAAGAHACDGGCPDKSSARCDWGKRGGGSAPVPPPGSFGLVAEYAAPLPPPDATAPLTASCSIEGAPAAAACEQVMVMDNHGHATRASSAPPPYRFRYHPTTMTAIPGRLPPLPHAPPARYRTGGAPPPPPPPSSSSAAAAAASVPWGELVFATYGDDKYAYQRERITAQAVASGWFTRVHEPFTRSDAERLVGSSAAAQAVLAMPRGGGYWIWKPLVVREVLSSLRENEVLLYADAGCSLVSGESESFWGRVRKLSEARPIDAHRLNAQNAAKIGCAVTNAVWSRMDTVRHVLSGGEAAQRAAADGAATSGGPAKDGAPGNGGNDHDDAAAARKGMMSAFLASDQVEAGRLLILNSARARALVDEWCVLALTRPDLFTDEPSSVPNHPSFKEHRHDQSVFSALLWRHRLTPPEAGEWADVPATQLRTEALQFWQGVQ